MNAHGIDLLFTSAAEVLITPGARQKYAHWADTIEAPAIKPSPPTTRAEATPHVLLRGPFEGDPTLLGVAFYVGVGLIEVRAFNDNDTRATYETRVIDGDGVEARGTFLLAARDLFFHDVEFWPEVHA